MKQNRRKASIYLFSIIVGLIKNNQNEIVDAGRYTRIA
jgi:hypothetical protein